MSYLMEYVNSYQGPRFELINLVYNTNNFYKKKFDNANLNLSSLTTVRSFNKIPYTHKSEILNDPYILSTVPKSWISEIGISTGTTGEDTLYIPYSFNDLYNSSITNFFHSSISIKEVIPINKEDTVINISPYEVTQIGLTIHRLLQDGFGAGVIPAGKCGFYSQIDKIFEVMCQKKPTCLVTSPSYAIHLAEYAVENNIELDKIPIKFIWLVGEACSDNLKKRISKIWSSKIQVRYGTLECGAIGLQCGVGNGYHIADNHCYVEIDEDEQFGKGIGEIIVTVFWRKASPLIKFRTGDYGRFLETPCDCGLHTPLIEVFGRKQSILKVGEQQIFLINIENKLFDYPEVGNWYQVKVEDDKIVIFAEPPLGGKAENKIISRIENDLKEEFNCTFDMKFVNKTPRFSGKVERIIR